MSESFRFTPPPKPAAPLPPEVDEEPEYDPRARLDYLAAVNPPKKKRTWLRVLLMVLVLVLVAGAGVYAYPRYFKKTAKTTTAKPSTSQNKQATPAVETKVATKQFDSTVFSLGFEYPETWTVNESADTSRLTVTAPATNQKTSAGTTELVRTVMTIAPKGQNLTAFEKGSALAVLSSEKIKYTNPTSAQRAETYLSFVQYNSTGAGNALDGIYITGDNGYQKDQSIPKADMDGRDPLIAITFERCTDSKCTTTPTATSLPSSTWNDSSFKNPILTMVKSLSVN